VTAVSGQGPSESSANCWLPSACCSPSSSRTPSWPGQSGAGGGCRTRTDGSSSTRRRPGLPAADLGRTRTRLAGAAPCALLLSVLTVAATTQRRGPLARHGIVQSTALCRTSSSGSATWPVGDPEGPRPLVRRSGPYFLPARLPPASDLWAQCWSVAQSTVSSGGCRPPCPCRRCRTCEGSAGPKRPPCLGSLRSVPGSAPAAPRGLTAFVALLLPSGSRGPS
jgi:hypothetical protein